MTPRNLYQKKLKGLYAITDENLITEKNFSQSIEFALQGGSKIIQYRDKSKNQQKRFLQASVVSTLCKKYQAISIINDDIELAKSVGADGVHLGEKDISIYKARQFLGEKSIIGMSCYNKLDMAIKAEKNNADYVAFGAMFPSPTKPDANTAKLELITAAKKQLSIPVCTIGGINSTNIKQLIQYGTDMAAVISYLFFNSDIKKTAFNLSKNFN